MTYKEPILQRIQKSVKQKSAIAASSSSSIDYDDPYDEDDDESAYSILEITQKYSSVGRLTAAGVSTPGSARENILRIIKRPSHAALRCSDELTSGNYSLFTSSSDEEEDEELIMHLKDLLIPIKNGQSRNDSDGKTTQTAKTSDTQSQSTRSLLAVEALSPSKAKPETKKKMKSKQKKYDLSKLSGLSKNRVTAILRNSQAEF